jgi:hypothetical protein
VLDRGVVLEPNELVDNRGAVDVSFVAGSIEVRQHLADAVRQGQERSGEKGRELQSAVAQVTEDALTAVRQGGQTGKAHEPGGTFDRVQRAEQAGQRVGGRRMALERDQLPFELVEHFAALRDELLDDDRVELKHETVPRVPSPFAPGPRACAAPSA